eukprot:GDKI01023386.1.p1 GENE.GDKI01023386.1~~GDKI01023386.1.p1  ORF type:complete len:302 (-),score=53.51 GDKI01023386.1:267-1172(-)
MSLSWENYITLWLPDGNQDAVLDIHLDPAKNSANGYCGIVIDDQLMIHFAGFLDNFLNFHLPHRPVIRAHVTLSQNQISDAGLKALVDVLLARRVHCSILRLYKNRIGDSGCWEIVRLLENTPEPIHELHLSHNFITERGATGLVAKIASHGGYPRADPRNPKRSIPIWLRLEHNKIADPQKFLEFVSKEKNVSCCWNNNRKQCGPSSCIHGHASKCPLIHFFLIESQNHREHHPRVHITEAHETVHHTNPPSVETSQLPSQLPSPKPRIASVDPRSKHGAANNKGSNVADHSMQANRQWA